MNLEVLNAVSIVVATITFLLVTAIPFLLTQFKRMEDQLRRMQTETNALSYEFRTIAELRVYLKNLEDESEKHYGHEDGLDSNLEELVAETRLCLDKLQTVHASHELVKQCTQKLRNLAFAHGVSAGVPATWAVYLKGYLQALLDLSVTIP